MRLSSVQLQSSVSVPSAAVGGGGGAELGSSITPALHQDRHALATLFSFIETKERVLTIGRVCHIWLKYSADPIAWAHDHYILQLHPSNSYPDEISSRYRPLIRSVRFGGVGGIKTVGSAEVSRMVKNLSAFSGLTELILMDDNTPTKIMNEIGELLNQLGTSLHDHGSPATQATSSHRSIKKLDLILSADQSHRLHTLFTSHLFRHLQQLHIRQLHITQVKCIAHLRSIRELHLFELHPKEVWDVIHRLPLLDTLTVRLCDPIRTRPLPHSLTSLTLPLLESDLDGRPLFSSLEASPPPQLRCVKLSLYRLVDSPDGAVHPGLNGLTQLIRNLSSLVSLTSFQLTWFHFTPRAVPEPQLSSIHFGWLMREFIRLNRSHLGVHECRLAYPMMHIFLMERREVTVSDEHLPNNVGPMAQAQFESIDEYLVAHPSTRSSVHSLFTLTAPFLSSLVTLHLSQVMLNDELLQSLIGLPTTTLKQLTIDAAKAQPDLFAQLEKCQQFWTMIGRQRRLQEFIFNPFRTLQVATNDHAWTHVDDQLLISCLKEVGTNFPLIAQCMPHRSQIEIKNRWFTTVRRIRHVRHLLADPTIPPESLELAQQRLQQQVQPLYEFCESVYDHLDQDRLKPPPQMEQGGAMIDSISIPSTTTSPISSSSASSCSNKFINSHCGSGGGLAGALDSCSALKKLEFDSYAPNTFFNESVCYALAQSPSLESLTLKLCSSELHLLTLVLDSSTSLRSLTLYTFPPSTDGNTPEATQIVLERDNVDKIEFLTLVLTHPHLTSGMMNGSPFLEVLRHEEQSRTERMRRPASRGQRCIIN